MVWSVFCAIPTVFVMVPGTAWADTAAVADPTPAGWKGWLDGMDTWKMFWVLFGFAGQACFMMRFVWQWFVSERRGEVVVPVVFWYFSLMGGCMLFVYSLYRRDPVFIVAQALGITIYVRNLMLIYRHRLKQRERIVFPAEPVERRPPDGKSTGSQVNVEKRVATS